MAEKSEARQRGGEHLYDALVDAGVDLLVGLPGTQTLPLDRTVVQRDEIDYLMARHETAIPHVAWGYYESSGRVAATITVPGPGDANASHGLKNALDDNVPLVHISPVPDPDEFGKHPIHEIEHDAFDRVVKANLTVETPARLRETIERGIETALTPPYGPIRLGIPSGFLDRPVESPAASVTVESTNYDTGDSIAAAADRLASAERPLVYVGGGARRSAGGPESVADVISLLDAPVAASYKGKGVIAEDSESFLGVTGADLPPGGRAAFEAADVVLALGTNFDGPNTTDWSLPMGETLVRVELDPAEIGGAYDADVTIVEDVARASERLGEELRTRTVGPKWDGAALGRAVREEYDERLRAAGLLNDGPPVSSPAVLRAVRDAAPAETVVTTDVGGHRIWSKNGFRAHGSESFVTAGSWAGMGVGLPSAIGAKLANPDRPVLTLTGDGSLMMCAQELHTAAERDLDLAVVLFNDADYGIISKSLRSDEGPNARQFGWESPDWVAIAEGYGCDARRVRTRSDVRDAAEWALETDGPSLIDVEVDSTEPTPFDVVSSDTNLDVTEF